MPRGRRHNKQPNVTAKTVGEDIDPEAEDFYQDEVEQFHSERSEKLLKSDKYLEPASSSDEEYSDEEDVLAMEVTDSEEEQDKEYEREVLRRLGHRVVSSDEEEESQGKLDGPSEKAWGKRKATFYSTDFVDDELGGSSNEEAAEQEEIEAVALQKRMAAALREDDFEVVEVDNDTMMPTTRESDKKQTDTNLEVVTRDLTNLSKDDKLEILAKEFPELFELLGDYKERLSEVISLQPLLKTARSHNAVLSPKALEWLELKVHLTLCYCTNIAFYLLLKSQQCPVKMHPVIGQLVQYRKLLSQLEMAGEEIEGEVSRNKVSLEDGEDLHLSMLFTDSSVIAKKQKVEDTKPVTEEVKSKKRKDEDPLSYYYKVKKFKEEKKMAPFRGGALEEDEGLGAEGDKDAKRAITYQISRNKGLTPKRKKEQRNPRVKHRKKFRKAVIKRKSQVPEVVHEQMRYGGELTGIRANLSRSVKIK